MLDASLQSAFKKRHSTETALVKLQEDFISSIDGQKSHEPLRFKRGFQYVQSWDTPCTT